MPHNLLVDGSLRIEADKTLHESDQIILYHILQLLFLVLEHLHEFQIIQILQIFL